MTSTGATTPLTVHVSRRSVHGPLSPLGAYRALADTFGAERAFLLESLAGPQADSRFSVCGLAGRAEIEVRQGVVSVRGEVGLAAALSGVLVDGGVVVDGPGGLRLVDDDALWQIPRAVEAGVAAGDEALFLLTFLGYDAARYIETLPRTIPDAPDAPPDAVFSLVEVLVQVGAADTQVVVVESPSWSGVHPQDVVAALAAGSSAEPVDRTDEPDGPLDAPAARSGQHDVGGKEAGQDDAAGRDVGSDGQVPPVPAPRRVSDDITRDEYLRRGDKCLEHIRVGDVYQVQLGHSITVETDAEPLVVYERLRIRNPSPYMALVPVAGRTVVCSSPELFARVSGGQAVMRPIAGTARRGGDEEAVKAALLADPKERAEHLMLVDLCRNDLGRVAQPGTLAVPALAIIETYSHVFHIVSQVECTLREGIDVADVLRAGFPAGTMSGAPKVRAMQIIEDLETTRRGFYAGAFGLYGLNGAETVLGLAIRMAVHQSRTHRGDTDQGDTDQGDVDRGEAGRGAADRGGAGRTGLGTYVLRASAGFVADSTPAGEWDETLNKMAATYWAVTGEELR